MQKVIDNNPNKCVDVVQKKKRKTFISGMGKASTNTLKSADVQVILETL